MDFEHLRLRREAECARFFIEHLADLFVFHLDRVVAAVANQEWDRVLHARMVAGDEGVDRLELVDESVVEQEIQRAIHGWRR